MEMKIVFTTVRPRFLVLALVCSFFFAAPALLLAQNPQTSAGHNQDEPKSIQDNSFLIEEAYNQENGVVQHISTLTRSWRTGDWVYTFTQEFPLRGLRHQLSYTLPVMRSPMGMGAGVGDVALNYRIQVIGNGDTKVAFAPRATLLLPTGNSEAGRGTGGVGVQTNLPLSVTIGRHFVTHWNAGGTIVPSARDAAGNRARIVGYNLGQSTIWLAHPRFNVLLETLWAGIQEVSAPGATRFSHELWISPGVRWAYNFKNGLQIVPGIGVPVGVGPNQSKSGLILYLSFEHPWAAFRKK